MFLKKKKQVPFQKRTDFSQYKMGLNMRVMCLFEEITDKPFMQLSSDYDILVCMYASFITYNEEYKNMTLSTFLYLVNDEEVVRWLVSEYERITAFISQFKKPEEENNEEDKEENEPLRMSDLAAVLIIKGGMDADYVYDRMPQYEIMHYINVMENMDRERMVEDRLWTYMHILPQIDSKKCKSPQQMLPFEWEEEQIKKSQTKQLEKDLVAARNALNNGPKFSDLIKM